MKFSFTKNLEVKFFYKESKSNKKKKKKILAGGRGGSVTRVSDFFFQMNPSLKKKIFLEGMRVRQNWLV